MSTTSRAAVAAVCLAALCGCAKVRVAPADPYSNERHGIPFYLQRPYVVVKKSFPAEGEEGYIVATVIPDATSGRSKLRLQRVPICLQACFRQWGFKDGVVELDIGDIRTMRIPLGPVEAVVTSEGAGGAISGGAPSDRATTTAKEQENDKSTAAKTSASMTARYDPAVDRTIDLGDYMTIAYLSDMDEKYVIDPDAGLGTASLSLALGAGGTLNQFNAEMDNRELGKFVFDTLGSVRDLALKKLRLDAASEPAVAGHGTGTSGGGPTPAPAPTTFILKYIYVGYAVPGTYPILKSREAMCAPDRERLAQLDPYLVPAVLPYTRYAMRVKRELSLYADSISGPAPAASRMVPAVSTAQGLLLRINELPAADRTVADESTTFLVSATLSLDSAQVLLDVTRSSGTSTLKNAQVVDLVKKKWRENGQFTPADLDLMRVP